MNVDQALRSFGAACIAWDTGTRDVLSQPLEGRQCLRKNFPLASKLTSTLFHSSFFASGLGQSSIGFSSVTFSFAVLTELVSRQDSDAVVVCVYLIPLHRYAA